MTGVRAGTWAGAYILSLNRSNANFSLILNGSSLLHKVFFPQKYLRNFSQKRSSYLRCATMRSLLPNPYNFEQATLLTRS